MTAFVRRHLVAFTLAGALALAGVSGFFVSQALSVGQQAPARTVTIDVGTGTAGPAGPAGPQGPAGDPGAEACPTGSTFSAVRINTPGGHVEIWACVKDE